MSSTSRSGLTRGTEAPVTRIPTLCNGCGNRCAIFAFVKNGRLWKIEGNPEANGNLGMVCPKGHGYLHDLYSPDRIRGPLKRVGDRFEPISWEQAYKEIGQKINLILMDHGPQSVFWVNYPQSNSAYALRLMHALGSPHYFTHGSTCYTARNAGWVDDRRGTSIRRSFQCPVHPDRRPQSGRGN